MPHARRGLITAGRTLPVLVVLTLLPATGLAQRAVAPDRNGPTTGEAVRPAGRGYYRSPSVHGETIVFVAEGDLWRVAATGGGAQRLTTHAGEETRPAISPDGQWIAFSATYEGPREVYLMPVGGGAPLRQTWEGDAADVAGWTSDGLILYATQKYSTLPNTQLVSLKPCVAERGQPGLAGVATNTERVCSPERRRLPLATGVEASLSPDGRTLFFNRFAKQSSFTKRYIGGTAENLWKLTSDVLQLLQPGSNGAAKATAEAVPLTADYPGTSRSPFWWNGRVYFASDRAPKGSAHPLGDKSRTWDAGVMNIWSMNESGADVRQHTFHTDYDVQGLSLHDGRIVYQQGADLWSLDLRASGTSGAAPSNSKRLDITLASDFEQMRENWVERPIEYLTSAHVSPSGDRIALVSRGNVFVAPVSAGRFVHVTRKPGVRYRAARFDADGKRLITLSDESGEVELWSLPADGMGEPEQLTRNATILRWEGVPSPDGRWMAHADKNQELWLYDTRTKEDRRIARNVHQGAWISSAPGYDPSELVWSPDGRWLAFNETGANYLGRIVLYDTQTQTRTAATTERYDSWSPAWSPDGQWLWILSNRTFSSEVGSPWGARQPDPYFEEQTRIFGIALKKGLRSPFTPRNELTAPPSTSAVPGAAAAAPANDAGGRGATTAPAPITIRSRWHRAAAHRGCCAGGESQPPDHRWTPPVLAAKHGRSPRPHESDVDSGRQ